MWFSAQKLRMPSAADAPPGRPESMPVPANHFVNGARLAPPFPEGMEQALFGMGCFWGAERDFWQMPGVYSTAVGYAGGFTRNPAYEEVCGGRTGHAEVVLVVFDPKAVSYDDLLKQFWEGHDPTQGMRQGNDLGTQYRSAINHFGDEQRRKAEATRHAYGEVVREAGYGPITTEIAPGASVLLRRGLSPAVPGQKPTWVLRSRRNRCGVPSRCHSRVTA